MIIRWHGQSAYTLIGTEHTVAIDPFGAVPTRGGGANYVRLPADRAPRRRTSSS